MMRLSRSAVRCSCALTLVAAGCTLASASCYSQASNRIKRPPPNFDEQQALAVEIAKSDGLLRPGDIIVTPDGRGRLYE